MLITSQAVPVLSFVSLATAMAGKHFVADFVLQTGWMARRKERPTGWVGPLAAHALCHGSLTLIVALAVAPALWWLALLDLGTHFMVDRAKASLTAWSCWTPAQARYWWLFGFDQMLHQLTNIAIIGVLLSR
jgi:hypothetical protein